MRCLVDKSVEDCPLCDDMANLRRGEMTQESDEDKRLCGSCDAGLPMTCTCPTTEEGTDAV